MGGGRKPKYLENVVVKPPRDRSQLVADVASTTGVQAEGGAAVVPLECQTFGLERTKVAARKVKAGMPIFGNVVGRNVEVRNFNLGVLGFAPSRVAAIISGKGRNRKWSGDVLSVDADTLSVEVTLCPL